MRARQIDARGVRMAGQGKRALVDVHFTQVSRPTDRTQTRVRSHLIDTRSWRAVDTADDSTAHSR